MSFGYTDVNEVSEPPTGFLRWRALPTGARIDYDWKPYEIAPEQCDQGVCFARFAGWSWGIESKRVFPDPAQASVFHEWRYARRTLQLPNPDRVTVTDPYGNDTVHNFHARNQDEWICYPPDPVDPFKCNKYLRKLTWSNGRPIQTDYYRGSAAAMNRLRTEYQVWADDVQDPNDPTFWRHTGTFARVVESGVIYHDDGGKTAKTSFDQWDGLGNFRKITEFGFDGQPYRVRRTDYNCDLRQPDGTCTAGEIINCAPSQPVPPYNCPLSADHLNKWILGTHTFSQTEDPNGTVLERSEAAFDGLGYQLAGKLLQTIPAGVNLALQPGNPSSTSTGDIKTEMFYEGDAGCPAGAATWRTGNLCRKTVRLHGQTVPALEETYLYAPGGYLTTRQVLQNGTPFSWKAEDREVDLSTGLTRVSRDPAGIATTLSYDPLGRLLRVTPAAVIGTEQFAELRYPTLLTTELEQAITGSDKIYSQFTFDKLGRLVKAEKRQMGGSLSKQESVLDPSGRKLFQSEWVGAGVNVIDPNTGLPIPTLGTTFDYTDPLPGPLGETIIDLFGRVRKVTAADGKSTRTDYAGTTSTVTVEGVKSGLGASDFLNAQTFFDKDAFGRLTRVLSHRTYAPSGQPLRAGADAYYTYDRLDRMTEVRLESQDDPNVPATSQYRVFTYNPLGRQIVATHPENGTTVNLEYDALGNLLRGQDAMGNLLRYEFDAASRLLRAFVAKPGLTERKVLENVYDQTGATGSGNFGYGEGRLTTTTSFDENEQPLVQEEWRFNGLNGRLSQKAWRFAGWNPDPAIAIGAQPEIVSSYAYNSLGLLSSMVYPERPTYGRTVASPAMTYLNGYLTSMTDPARGNLIESLAYNVEGGLWKIKTRGSVETVVTHDSRYRPANIVVTKTSGTPVTHFNSGSYSYDGAGNISAIGNDKYAYDPLSRLIAATVNDTASGKIEDLTWKYDPLGNMTSQLRKTTAVSTFTTAENKFVMNAKNQISTQAVERFPASLPQDSPVTVEYDGNGNLVVDRINEYVFDTRNRLLEVKKKTDASLIARYAYDAGGFRFRKFDPATGLTTFYLRDASGQTVSEFRRPDLPGAQPAWAKDYVYALGRHVAAIENEVPATPGGITVAVWGGEVRWVDLNWAAGPDVDLSGYYVQRTGDGQTITSYVEPASVRAFTDSTVANGVTYTFTISALDTAGKWSAWSEPVVVTPGDSTSPEPPAPVLPAVAGEARVDLAWISPSVADLWSFKVYRKGSSETIWAQVGGTLHRSQATFTDSSAQNNVEYDYQVRAIDTSGNASTAVPATPAWRVTPRDTTPPDTPQGLYAIAADTSVGLYWRKSNAADAVSYRLYRRDLPTSPWALAATLSPSTPIPLNLSVTDPNVAANQTWRYAVAAVDTALPLANESAKSAEILVATRDTGVSKPSIISTNWGHCMTSDYAGNCYLPDNDSSDFTHENWRQSFFTWSAGATGAALKVFRLYSRPSTNSGWQLAREFTPIPGNLQYPIATNVATDPNYKFQDNGFSPDDSCGPTYFRVSAVATIGGVDRESLLSDETQPPTPVGSYLPIPENLTVVGEVVDPNSCTLCPLTCVTNPSTCVNARLNADHYGLTLSWTPGGPACGGTLAGYHVYRNRHTYQAGAPPIRITRDPVGVPVMRVEYLPLKGPKSLGKAPPAAFVVNVL